MVCLAGRVNVLVDGVVGTTDCIVVDALSYCCLGKDLQSSLYRGSVRQDGES